MERKERKHIVQLVPGYNWLHIVKCLFRKSHRLQRDKDKTLLWIPTIKWFNSKYLEHLVFMEWSFLTSDHCMKLQGENLKICKTAWRSLKMLLALHFAFHHEAKSRKVPLFSILTWYHQLCKTGLLYNPPPAPNLSQSSFLTPESQNWNTFTGWLGELRLGEGYFPDVPPVTIKRSCRAFHWGRYRGLQ